MTVAARPPLGVGDLDVRTGREDLPVGWQWWDTGLRPGQMPDVVTEWTTKRPEDPALVVREEREHWMRTLRSADMRSLSSTLVDAWRADRRPTGELVQAAAHATGVDLTDGAATAELVSALPEPWRSWTLRRIGYGAIGHGQLLGTDTTAAPAEDAPGEWWHLHTTVRPGRAGWTHHPHTWLVLDVSGPYRWHADRCWDLRHRVARAADGTPVPAGWEPVDDPAPSVPWDMSEDDMLATVMLRVAPPPSELTSVVVRRQPSGRWSYATGTGGHSRVRGEAATQEEAAASARHVLGADQEEAWARAREQVRGHVELLSGGWGVAPPEPRVEVLDLVSPAEIAARLGVRPATVAMWRLRSRPGAVDELAVPLPEPIRVLSNVPVWDWETIRRWAEETGRLERNGTS